MSDRLHNEDCDTDEGGKVDKPAHRQSFESERIKEPVLAGLHAKDICSKCGQPHRRTNEPCTADERDSTPLLPGRSTQLADFLAPEEKEDEDEDTLDCQLPVYDEALDKNAQISANLLDDRSPEDLVGHTLVDRYALLSLLGKGGMSVVFRAKDLKLNKIVAVKLLLPHLASKEITAKRFRIEAQAASSLYHPNLITIHDYGVTDKGMPYIVMDLLEGKSLSEILKEDGALPIKRAIPILIQITDALAHAHGKNVLHRDLKPSNVMVTSTESQFDLVKLVDFGIAKVLRAEDEASIDLTRTGEIFGSPQYMSPEQCSSQAMDARSDIYSMGCLMYELLTGKPVFESDNVMEVLFAQVNDSPPDFKVKAPNIDIPQRLQVIVLRCLAKDPSDRYQCALDLSADLNRFSQTATDIFIKQVQAKWQVFKLQQRPLRKREKKYLLASLLMAALLCIASFKLISLYWGDNSMETLSIKQAFMPVLSPEESIPIEKQMLNRAMETGFNKRLESISPNSTLEEKDELADSAEKVAKTYLSYKQYDLARHYFQITIDLLEKYDSKTREYSALFPRLRIGNCLYAQGKYAESIPYFKKFSIALISLQQGERDRSYLLESLIYQATAEYSAGKIDDAIYTFDKIFKTMPEVDLRPSNGQIALIYSQLGDCYRLKQNYNSAIEAYKKASAIYAKSPELRTTGDTINMNRYLLSQYLVGYCQYKLRKFEEAQETYESVLPKLRNLSLDLQHLRVSATAQYSELLWKRGNFTKSIEMHFKAKDLQKLSTL